MPVTQDEAAALLAQSTGRAAYPQTTQSRLALASTAPTSSAAGTEVAGAGYARQTVTGWTEPSRADPTTTTVNVGAVSFENMPAVTTSHVNVYGSEASPRRKWYGSLTTARTTQQGDTLTFADASLQLGIVCAVGNTPST